MGSPLTYGIGSDPLLVIRARRIAEQRRMEEEEAAAEAAADARGEEARLAFQSGPASSAAAMASRSYRSPRDISLDAPPPTASRVGETRTISPALAALRLRQQAPATPAPEAPPDDFGLAANQATAATMDEELATSQAKVPTSALRYRIGNDPWMERTYREGGDFTETAETGPPAPVRGALSVMGRTEEEMPPSDYDIEQAERAKTLIEARRLSAQAQREEQHAATEAEDPYGISAHVARKLAEMKAMSKDPREQRRAKQETRRAAEGAKLDRLRSELAARGATPEEAESSIRNFVMQSAARQALRDGNFGPLGQILSRMQKQDENDLMGGG